MSNSSEREMQNFQEMLNQASERAEQEKQGEEAKFKSHLENIKEKFAETVKEPLEGLASPLLFENAKDLIKKGVKKALGTAFDDGTTEAINNLVENSDVKGFTNHIVDKLVKKHNVEDILARPADETDSEGLGSAIKSKLSKVLGDFKENVSNKLKSLGQSLKDGTSELRYKLTGKIPRLNMSSEINHISPYQDPFSTGLDNDLVTMASKGDLASARATLAFRQTSRQLGGTADDFLDSMRNARSLASNGLTNNQSSFQIGDAIRAESQRLDQTQASLRQRVQASIDQAKQRVNQLDRTDENAPSAPTDLNAPQEPKKPDAPEQPEQPEKPTFNPSEQQKGSSNVDDLASAHGEMEEGETRKIGGKIFKKAGSEMLEVDELTGGGADIFGDIAGAVIGLGSLFAGLFSHKRNLPKPPPMPTLRPSVEFGV